MSCILSQTKYLKSSDDTELKDAEGSRTALDIWSGLFLLGHYFFDTCFLTLPLANINFNMSNPLIQNERNCSNGGFNVLDPSFILYSVAKT